MMLDFIAYTMIQNFITGKINAVSSNPISFYEIANLIKSTESKNLITLKKEKFLCLIMVLELSRKVKFQILFLILSPSNLKSYIKDYFNE